MQRIQRDRRLTPEEVEKVRLARDAASQEVAEATTAHRENPSGGHCSVEDVLELRCLVANLRTERERQALSLSEVARRALLDVSLLEAIEGNRESSPALSVLTRYARALGGHIRLQFLGKSPADSQPLPAPRVPRAYQMFNAPSVPLFSRMTRRHRWITSERNLIGQVTLRSPRLTAPTTSTRLRPRWPTRLCKE